MANTNVPIEKIDPTDNDYNIRILLHGLLVSAFKKMPTGAYEYQIGVLNSVVSNHTLRLCVYDLKNSNNQEFAIGEDSVIELTGLSDSGIKQFQRTDPATGNWDERDFRWVLDYEDLYTSVQINKSKIGATFIVRNGVAHSLVKSSELQIGATNPQGFRKIAQVVAIDITIPNGEQAILTGAKSTFTSKDHYHITFRYDCDNNCEEDIKKPVDLNHLNKTFKVANSQTPNHDLYYLSSLTEIDIDAEMDAELGKVYKNKKINPLKGLERTYPKPKTHKTQSSRIAPCGVALFGKSKGLK